MAALQAKRLTKCASHLKRETIKEHNWLQRCIQNIREHLRTTFYEKDNGQRTLSWLFNFSFLRLSLALNFFEKASS